jgi:DNA polymerase III alpha subunit (gram-positive type)
MKLLFLDIETTGFSRQFDYIIELAGIVYDTVSKKEIAQFHEYIKPKKSIPIQVTEITRITNQQVANCRSESEVLTDFISFIEHHKPDHYVGHNIDAFDIL